MLPSARGVLLTLSILSSSLLPAVAGAQQTPYCKQVRAKAASDAGYLMSPRVVIQGLHFARGAELADSGPIAGTGYQVRTGLSFSPVDYYKGRAVLRAGDADCKRHEASAMLDDVLSHATEVARLSALLQQGEFLRTRTEDWRGLSARAATRLSQRIITVVEFTSVQRSIDTLEHKLVSVEGEAEQLKARQLRVAGMLPSAGALANSKDGDASAPRAGAGVAVLSGSHALRARDVGPAPAGRLEAAVQRWRDPPESDRLVRHAGAQLQPRHAGARPAGAALHGRPLRGSALRPRRRGDAPGAVSRPGPRQRSSKRAETSVLVDHSLEVLRATRLALEQSEAESAAQARDLIAIEQVSVESDSVFLRSFVGALETLMARARG
jgi:hypothetical protein